MDNQLTGVTNQPNREEEKMQVVVFKLGNEEYAVDVLNVQEIIRILHITRVPHAIDSIEGVMNLRGNIIPVLNLHKQFNIEYFGKPEDRRIIVFNCKDTKAGIIVDKVSEVLHLDKNDIEATSQLYNSIDANLINGVAKINDRLIIILEIENLFNTSSI